MMEIQNQISYYLLYKPNVVGMQKYHSIVQTKDKKLKINLDEPFTDKAFVSLPYLYNFDQKQSQLNAPN